MNTPLVSALNALRLKSKLPPAEIVGVLGSVGVDVIWNGEAQTFEAPGERIAVTEAIAAELHGAAASREMNVSGLFRDQKNLHAAHLNMDEARAFRMAANFLNGVAAG